MKLMRKFPLLPPDKRPQDPNLDGTGLRFKTLDHGGEYPDTMPQAIQVTDRLERTCLYSRSRRTVKSWTQLREKLTTKTDDFGSSVARLMGSRCVHFGIDFRAG